MLFAVVDSRGWSFVFIGPVASAANTFTDPPTIDGKMAMVKNTIPNPPIHCDRLRQIAQGEPEHLCDEN